MQDLSRILGKEFESKLTGVGYGVIRERGTGLPGDFSVQKFGMPFAQDDCGNLFTQTQTGSVGFWNHETDDLTVIAATWIEFSSGCAELKKAELSPGQVKQVWVDPNFKAKLK